MSYHFRLKISSLLKVLKPAVKLVMPSYLFIYLCSCLVSVNIFAEPIDFSFSSQSQTYSSFSKSNPNTQITITDSNGNKISQITGKNIPKEKPKAPTLPVKITETQRVSIINKSAIIYDDLTNLKNHLEELSKKLPIDTKNLHQTQSNYYKYKKSIFKPFLETASYLKEELKKPIELQGCKMPYDDCVMPVELNNIDAVNPVQFIKEIDVIYNTIESALISIEKKFSLLWDIIRNANLNNVIDENLGNYVKSTLGKWYWQNLQEKTGDDLSGKIEQVIAESANSKFISINFEGKITEDALWAKASELAQDRAGVQKEVTEFFKYAISKSKGGKLQLGYNEDLLVAFIENQKGKSTLLGYIDSRKNYDKDTKVIIKNKYWDPEQEVREILKKQKHKEQTSADTFRNYLEVYEYTQSNKAPIFRWRYTPTGKQKVETYRAGRKEKTVIRPFVKGKELAEIDVSTKTLYDSAFVSGLKSTWHGIDATFSGFGEVLASSVYGIGYLATLWGKALAEDSFFNNLNAELEKSVNDNILQNSIVREISGKVNPHEEGSNNISNFGQKFKGHELLPVMQIGAIGTKFAASYGLFKGFQWLKARQIAKAEALGKPTVWGNPIGETFKKFIKKPIDKNTIRNILSKVSSKSDKKIIYKALKKINKNKHSEEMIRDYINLIKEGIETKNTKIVEVYSRLVNMCAKNNINISDTPIANFINEYRKATKLYNLTADHHELLASTIRKINIYTSTTDTENIKNSLFYISMGFRNEKTISNLVGYCSASLHEARTTYTKLFDFAVQYH